MPFRSTLKKVEARWVGDQQGGISGSAKLLEAKAKGGYISGTLTNQTASDLSNVYFFFHHPAGNARTHDWVLFVPYWKKGDQLDLSHEFDAAPPLSSLRPSAAEVDWSKTSARGWIDGMWSTHWYTYFDGQPNSDKAAVDVRGSLPMLTAFDLLPPPMNTTDKAETVVGILRRGGRVMNLSPAILAAHWSCSAKLRQRPSPAHW